MHDCLQDQGDRKGALMSSLNQLFTCKASQAHFNIYPLYVRSTVVCNIQ